MARVAILYIAVGKYDIFWKDFYNSSEEFFLIGHEKKYFVFTDSTNILDKPNVNTIYQENLGWPKNTLMRFDFFLSIDKALREFDYIFFFNANMLFLSNVDNEVLPKDSDSGLVMVIHPYFFGRPSSEFTFERNPKSRAYIPKDEGLEYVQGCLIGGKSKEFLQMSKICSNNIHEDLKNNIIAKWHDESHLNKYILDKKPLFLPPNYAHPESCYNTPFKSCIKIIQLDKNNPKYGGLNNLRINK